MPLESVRVITDEPAQDVQVGAANALREEAARIASEKSTAAIVSEMRVPVVPITPIVPFFPEQKLLSPLLSERKHPIYFGSVPEYAAFGGILLRNSAHQFAGALAGAGGGIQAMIDGQRLINSSSLLEGTKYGAAMIADGSIVAGGISTAFKLGPKWLAPTLLLGGFVGRITLDLIPDERKK